MHQVKLKQSCYCTPQIFISLVLKNLQERSSDYTYMKECPQFLSIYRSIRLTVKKASFLITNLVIPGKIKFTTPTLPPVGTGIQLIFVAFTTTFYVLEDLCLPFSTS